MRAERPGLVAINCTHLAGRIRNDIGLVNTLCMPARIGAQTPMNSPISW